MIRNDSRKNAENVKLEMKLNLAAAFLVVCGLWNAAKALKDVETVITSATACEICDCVAGENPRDVVVCRDLVDAKIISLPSFVNSIRVIHASGKVVFKRGSIRTPSKFKVTAENLKFLEFEEKSLNILNQGGGFEVQLRNIDEAHCLRESLSASDGGEFSFKASKVHNLHLNSKAFDVLDNVTFADVGTLHLAPFALKPNRSPKGLNFRAQMERTNIRTLPSDTFPPSAQIQLVDCQIADVDNNAFSGNMVQTINLVRTSIDRIHGQAFPEKMVIHQLIFDGCHLTSLSERSIVSAMSSLVINNTFISSISSRAVDSFVATIVLNNNTFNTLSQRALTFKSWSDLKITDNHFKFVESEAFAGISNDEPNVAFNFSGNRISSANRNALNLNLTHLKDAKISANIYYKDCHCNLLEELDMLTGNHTQAALAIRNTSLCKVPVFAKQCFTRDAVLIGGYVDLMCKQTACQTSELDYVWTVFQDKIEVHSNRGILLIVLLFVLASCLVVGIVTLLRWIVFTLQNRGKYEQDDEWNFTKVEERLVVPSPLPQELPDQLQSSPSSQEQHYESLPLTTTEVLLESVPSSPTNAKQPEPEVSVPPDVVQEQPIEGTVGHKPPQTFYDEMLCLLKEKLDDPDNYATVVDTTSAPNGETQHLLYQDPLDLNKD